MLVNTLVLLAAATILGGAPPESLVRHGGFDRSVGWTLGPGHLVDEGNPDRCLRFDRQGGASQDLLTGHAYGTLTVACDLRTSDVRPTSGSHGYAFAAVYQTDENGRLVANHDFAQLRGTKEWDRFSYTFKVDPRADTISLRCGVFQADGVAWFDNWTLVAGSEAKRLDEVRQPESRSAKGPARAAILYEPGMPKQGCPSDPEILAAIIKRADVDTTLLSADELADPSVFHAGRYDLVVVPTGRTFPAKARRNFIEFLRHGGAYLSTGGYAFDDLVRNVDGRWRSEVEVVQDAHRRAMDANASLLPNGGFEQTDELPLGGVVPDGAWRRSGAVGRVGDFEPHEGGRCAEVQVPQGQTGAQCHLDLTSVPGTTYTVSGWMRTGELIGDGMAFMAVYQYDADDELVEFRDFAIVRKAKAWHQHSFAFTPGPTVRRISLRFGLYNRSGTAWFDDFRLGDVTGAQFLPMNTSTGRPADGLDVLPAQIGAFDASYRLKRACHLRTAMGQHVVQEPIDRQGPLEGWAASGVVGYDNARWIPILETYDRYDRPRGPAAAVLVHYNGFYAGSAWAYFGLENVDLFDSPHNPNARLLEQLVRFLIRRTYLHNLETNVQLYRGDEPVEASVVVENGIQRDRRLVVRFDLHRGDDAEPTATKFQTADVSVGVSEEVRVVFDEFDRSGDTYRVVATLVEAETAVDEMETGFVLEQPAQVARGPQLQFTGNYFTLRGRPMFLFGSDTYSRTYKTACENPWTWSQELKAARDIGLNLYENLQYSNPGHRLEDSDWRSFEAMNQLVQKHGLVFMPGMLIGHSVAIGEEEMSEQSRLCAAYAERFADTPGLLYYINGDYRMDLDKRPEDVRRLWNDWLASRYGSTAKLRAAWGDPAAELELGKLIFPPPNSGRWDDVAAVDRMRFQNWLTRRWNAAHVAAVRQHDQTHPITSEYYQRPFAGMDLVMTIDAQDVSNIGYFDRPVEDITQLPLKICFNDLRARGKGVSLGEYGVKTHRAWTVENGATGYHILRTEEEQKQLFMAVAHYALGLGGSKVQNWCLRDAQARVFPWGMFYPNQLVPKDVAYVHRNQSLIWRHFRPRYEAPKLIVCLPNQLRLGNDEALGRDVAYRTFDDLLALHYPFGTIDDHHLEQIPTETQVMILPSPFALRDDSFDRLLAWVRGGGTLIVTGDFSYDADRQRTRVERLVQLAGVEFVGENYPNVRRDQGSGVEVAFRLAGLDQKTLRPCIQVRPVGADVFGQTGDGQAVLTRYGLGDGSCWLLTDPIHLDASEQAPSVRRRLLKAILDTDTNLKPISATPDADWLHVMEQPTERGKVHVVYNTKLESGQETVRLETAAGPLELSTRNRWPALAAVAEDGSVVAVNVDGVCCLGEDRLVSGVGLKALLSLDGHDIRQSEMLLVAPFEPGNLDLPERSGAWTAVFGDCHDGRWRTLEKLPLGTERRVEIDEDRATCLILICRPERGPPAMSR
jgi:glycosyl hydrolase family 42 (putative beta-galactosidase)